MIEAAEVEVASEEEEEVTMETNLVERKEKTGPDSIKVKIDLDSIRENKNLIKRREEIRNHLVIRNLKEQKKSKKKNNLLNPNLKLNIKLQISKKMPNGMLFHFDYPCKHIILNV